MFECPETIHYYRCEALLFESPITSKKCSACFRLSGIASCSVINFSAEVHMCFELAKNSDDCCDVNTDGKQMAKTFHYNR